MTMSLLPGVDGALDVCDITVIVERNALSCTIYLRGNSAVACNAPASDVADAINVDQLPYILPGIPSSVGVIWVNAQNVLRLTADPASGGTLCQMEVGGGTFAIPSLALELAIQGVNDCGRCGGGAPPPPVVQTGYADAGDYSPTLGGGPGNTVTILGDAGTFARTGQLANAGEPESGDTVVVGIKVRAEVLAGNILSASFNDGLPGPIDGQRIAVSVTPNYTIGGVYTSWEIESSSDNNFVVKGYPASVAFVDVELDIVGVYQVAAQ